MIAHILCPGPSLPLTWSRQGFGPIIAVNRALDFTACDWLVAGDAITYTRVRGIPLTGVCSFNDVLRNHLPPRFAQLQKKAWDDFPPSPTPPQWGIEGALLLACHLAIGEWLEIDIFGCDQAGTEDWDGTGAADDRSDARWDRERAAVNRTVEYLRTSEHIPITFHRPPKVTP